MRDRLIELIKQGDKTFSDKYTGKVMSHIDEVYGFVADYLLSEGVVVPPCKVGQTVWFIRTHVEKIVETKVDKVVLKNGGLYLQLSCNSFYETTCRSIGKTVFLTREKAEKSLAERSENGT